MIGRATFTVADEAQITNYVNMPGYRLVGLLIPTIDSAAIGFRVALDAAGTGSQIVAINTHATAYAALNLGNAAVTARYVAVPEEVGEASAHAFVALTFSAAQNGGPYEIIGFFRRDT